MRTKVIVILSVVILLIGGTAAAQSYDNYKSEQRTKLSDQQKKQADLQKKQDQLNEKLVTRMNELHNECVKGQKAFAALSSVQKKGYLEPYCGEAVLQ